MDPINKKSAIRKLQEKYRAQGNPRGWYEEVYHRATGNTANIPWLDLEPNPKLVDWLSTQAPLPDTAGAMVVACGLGDDAEALAANGYQVTAFDLSTTAIQWCQQRFPETEVNYQSADLFSCPQSWLRKFDLVFECNTIQALPAEFRLEALARIAEFVAPGGKILVSCRSREAGTKEDEIPVPLSRQEIDGFIRAQLVQEYFEAWDDGQDPPVPHFFAIYSRPEGQGC